MLKGRSYLVLLDLLSMEAGFLTAYLKGAENLLQANLELYRNNILWLFPTALMLFYLCDFYTNWNRKSFYQLFFSLCMALLLFALITIPVTLPHHGLVILVQTVLILGTHSLAWWLQQLTNGQSKTLIIGREVAECRVIKDKFFQHSQGWFKVAGCLVIEDQETIAKTIPEVDILLLSRGLSRSQRTEISESAIKQGKEVLYVPELIDLLVQGSQSQQVDDLPVLAFAPLKPSKYQQIIKRFMDIIISILLLTLASPVILLLYILIPLTSPGAAIYTQHRVGLNSRPYLIYKFRSMVKDAEKKTGPMLALESDPRITKLGRLIRRTRLDELPQLFNVIKGEMSLVGPRPEREYFVNQFKERIPGYQLRYFVKPGITGAAQVTAKYSTSVEDKLYYDLMYIRNYSYLTDLRILFKTVFVLFRRDQSAGVKTRTNKGGD